MLKISVIMPVYNMGKYVEKAIQSFLSQSIDDKELICINNASTDESIEVIRRYSDKFPMIRLVNLKKNEGAGIARNVGIEQAQGKYVCFLDADDFYVNDYALDRLFQCCEKNNLKACAGLMRFLKVNGDFEDNPLFRNMFDLGSELVIKSFKDDPIDHGYTLFIFRRDLLMKYEIRFPNLRRYQDPPFLINTLYFAREYGILNENFYCYRIEYRNRKFDYDSINDIFKGFLNVIQFAISNEDTEKLLKRTVERLNTNYFKTLCDGLDYDNCELINILLQIRDLIEPKGYELCVFRYLLFLKSRLQSNGIDDFSTNEFIRANRLNGKRIAVYGAGNIGERLVSALKENGLSDVVLWVDRYKAGEETKSIVISNVETLNNCDWDVLVIAIYEKDLSNSIRKYLDDILTKEHEIIEWASGNSLWHPIGW